MKLKIAVLTGLLSMTSLQASTTMQLGSGGTLTNLQTQAGSANSALVWGLLVDTSGNGFQGGNYSPGFTLSDTNALAGGQFLSTTSGVTDDRLFISSNFFATAGTVDGSTGLSKPTNILLSYSTDGVGANGVSALGGQSVALVWFDSLTKTGQQAVDGNKYGLYILPFTTPADQGGGNLPFGSNFLGVDAVRTASLTVGVVPEPSVSIFGLVGVLGLLRRRRN
jgi:hypothetical protein